jgi:N4-(beta-N-acetylglucosaminyl)-L-asparaginase
MKNTRRDFLMRSAAVFGMVGLGAPAWSRFLKAHPQVPADFAARTADESSVSETETAVMVSTWSHGLLANVVGFSALDSGGTALDMIEAAARLVEEDAEGLSVGIGGLPDRDGHVTLDACIMDHTGDAGSVCFVQNVLYPLSLARRVMEDTPHVILAGAGAEQFARELGIPEIDLLTEKARTAWERWRKESNYAPVINIENHDTIGLLAMDNEGRLAGGCTTSGVAYKMHGRVGDSPIIGAGLFVDGQVGGATATGLGEAVLRTVGSFLVVELMRQGRTPQAACEEAVHRIMNSMPTDKLQVGYLALSRDGESGGHAIHNGFNYARTTAVANDLIDATHG